MSKMPKRFDRLHPSKNKRRHHLESSEFLEIHLVFSMSGRDRGVKHERKKSCGTEKRRGSSLGPNHTVIAHRLTVGVRKGRGAEMC